MTSLAHEEPPPEAGSGDEAAPALAHEGGADEARRLVRREAEEDLLDEVVIQRPRRGHAGGGARVWPEELVGVSEQREAVKIRRPKSEVRRPTGLN